MFHIFIIYLTIKIEFFSFNFIKFNYFYFSTFLNIFKFFYVFFFYKYMFSIKFLFCFILDLLFNLINLHIKVYNLLLFLLLNFTILLN